MSICKTIQWRRQNAENIMHIKGSLLDQAVTLLNCASFIIGTLLKGKNLRPEGANSGGEFFSLRAVPYGMENHSYNIR